MRRFRTFAAATTVALVAALGSAAAASAEEPPPGANDFSCKPSNEHPRPVILVHGLSASMSANWGFHSPRIAAAGYCVFALTYGQDERNASLPYNPGGVIRMEGSSRELKRFVRRVRRATGANEVDLIGHSEGTVMPRWYLERRGGVRRVKRFIALTPLWRGTELGGAAYLRDVGTALGFSDEVIANFESFCASCPQFVRGSDYLNDLNADGEAIPGIVHTNIITRTDELVVPYTSGVMSDGGTNIVLQSVCPTDLNDHTTTAFDPVVTQLFLNALAPAHAKPVRCFG